MEAVMQETVKTALPVLQIAGPVLSVVMASALVQRHPAAVQETTVLIPVAMVAALVQKPVAVAQATALGPAAVILSVRLERTLVIA
jgi:hypothetical protein